MNLLTPVTLVGKHATLVPLSIKHCEGLTDATKDGELWKLWYTGVPGPEKVAAEIEKRLALHAQGSMLPFTVIDSAT
ncbi:MAG: N-acetyltransferase, partial [Verrucomicrobia bacterium]|nr:N-acetyltransferase [Verrucomicrobiota bacterium]